MPPRRTVTPASRGTTPATTASSFTTTPEATSTESDLDRNSDNHGPAVLVSPIRRRQRNAAPTIRSQSDASVWDLADEEIIG
jgi:hypothetical protein